MLLPVMRERQMLRVWLAMFGASVATFFVHDAVSYMAVDAIAAAIVMARPAGLAQRAIGALFIWMMMLDLGFYLSTHDGWELFVALSTLTGWLQWLILGTWAGHDAWRRYRLWADAPYRPPAAIERRVP
jgi:hypothetical protein